MVVEHGSLSLLQDGAIMPAWSYRNTLKSLREPTYAREFAQVLAANGARVV